VLARKHSANIFQKLWRPDYEDRYGIFRGEDSVLEPPLQRCWRHEVHGMQKGVVQWEDVLVGALEGSQGRLQAVELRAGGWQRHGKPVILPDVCVSEMDIEIGPDSPN
jgi:hypothetical protein